MERRAATASESRPMEPVAYLTSWMNLGSSMNRDADSVVRASRVQYMVVIGLRAVVTGTVCINLLNAIVKTRAVRLYERSRHPECR